MDQCFKFDWQSSRIVKIVREEKERKAIYYFLRGHYRAIKDTYKYFSAMGLTGDVFSIPINAFTEFMNQSDIVDGKLIKLSEMDILFITTNTVSVKLPFNPDRALVRYQFMEILVRIAFDKYLKNKLCDSPSEAVRRLFQEHTLKAMSLHNIHGWRESRLWNEKCDLVLKAYSVLLKDIYQRYSGQKSKPGQKKFMSVDELRKFCYDCELLAENFQDRDVNTAFNFSIMLQVDELNLDRHLQMYFPEFIEAFARIAERCSLVPYAGKEAATKSYELRYQMPLWYKIEGLFERAYKTCVSADTRDNFLLPEGSIFGEFDFSELQ